MSLWQRQVIKSIAGISITYVSGCQNGIKLRYFERSCLCEHVRPDHNVVIVPWKTPLAPAQLECIDFGYENQTFVAGTKNKCNKKN